jgi:hypothetical protein
MKLEDKEVNKMKWIEIKPGNEPPEGAECVACELWPGGRHLHSSIYEWKNGEAVSDTGGYDFTEIINEGNAGYYFVIELPELKEKPKE